MSSEQLENSRCSVIETPHNFSKSLSLLQSSLPKPALRLELVESAELPADYSKSIYPTKLTEGETVDPIVLELKGKTYCSICFDEPANKYYITDAESGIFIKVNQETVLVDKQIISFGKNHMIAHIKEHELELHFIEGPKMGEMYKVTSNEITYVGRMVDCKIVFEDMEMSRYQCYVYYDRTKGWIINDGDGFKASLNGTWIFTQKKTEVSDQMVFTSADSVFKINLS